MPDRDAQPPRVRIGLVSDHLFPFAHGGAERVYRVLADAIAAEGAELSYYTRTQWEPGTPLKTEFAVESVWSGSVYDERGTRTIGAALRWSSALLRTLWRAELDVLIVSATPVFNVFVGMLARIRRPRMVLVVDWLEIWPWKKWRSYSGLLAGTIAWILQSMAVHIGSVRTVNSRTTLERLPKRAQATAIQLPLVSMAGPPRATAHDIEPTGLLFVGRHIPDKNLPLLPEVMQALVSSFPKLTATVVGDGPDRAVAEARASHCGVADRISFVGRVSDEALERLLASSSLLFFPSVREGFGLVVCEAARFGTPSVVVDHPDNAAAALITEGQNGARAASADVTELAAATERVLAAGTPLREQTQQWYEQSWAQGGFETVARQLIALALPKRSTAR